MKKKILSLLLVVCLSLLSLNGCGLVDFFRAEQGGSQSQGEMTRGEWVAILTEAFNMDTPSAQEPYFSDVTQDDPLYPYVQSAAGWDVLAVYSGSETFDANQPVTWEEMAASAAIAAGWAVTEDQFDENGVFDPSGAVDYAVSQGIVIPGQDPGSHPSREEGVNTVSGATTAYLSPPPESSSVVFRDTVVNVSGTSLQITGPHTGTVTTNGAGDPVAVIDTELGPVEVSEGSVLITAPTALYPSGVAYKVAAIRETDGQVFFDTAEPTLEDLYEELNVTATVAAGPDQIIWEDGVTAALAGTTAGGGAEFQVALLSARSKRGAAVPLSYSTGFSQDFRFGSGNFTQTWTNQNSSALSGGAAQALENSNFVYTDTPSIEDFGGSTESWTKNLQIENKFSGGYEITGNITLNTLTVTTHVDFKRGLFNIPYGVNSAYVQVNSDISSTLTLKGNLQEELKIATVPIPIAATGLSVTIDLYLYATASGTLEVAAKLSTMAKVEYAEGSGIKSTKNANATATADASIELGFGAKLSASLDALGVVKIMDASVQAGAEVTAEAHLLGTCDVTEADGTTTLYYKESLDMQADIYAPIVTISAGGSNTLLGKLGLSKSWNVLTRDNCWHANLLDKEWIFWEATVTMDGDGNILSQEEGAADQEADRTQDSDGETQVSWGRLDLDSYYCALSVGERYTIHVSRLPEGRSESEVVWSTADAGIATVAGGVVTATGTGVTTVSARLDDVTVLCTVSVS